MRDGTGISELDGFSCTRRRVCGLRELRSFQKGAPPVTLDLDIQDHHN